MSEMQIRSEDDIWWEDNDFHVIDTEGKEHVFKDAYLTKEESQQTNADSVVTQEVTMKYLGS